VTPTFFLETSLILLESPGQLRGAWAFATLPLAAGPGCDEESARNYLAGEATTLTAVDIDAEGAGSSGTQHPERDLAQQSFS